MLSPSRSGPLESVYSGATGYSSRSITAPISVRFSARRPHCRTTRRGRSTQQAISRSRYRFSSSRVVVAARSHGDGRRPSDLRRCWVAWRSCSRSGARVSCSPSWNARSCSCSCVHDGSGRAWRSLWPVVCWGARSCSPSLGSWCRPLMMTAAIWSPTQGWCPCSRTLLGAGEATYHNCCIRARPQITRQPSATYNHW